MVKKNHIIIASCIVASAICPVRNPATEPIDARKDSWIDRPCRISRMSTTIKGKIIIPKGGKIKDPTITDKAAPFSPTELPPYFFTDRELANISAKVSMMVNMTITIQKNVVNSPELMKK